MKNELITLERAQLATTCGGTVATSPWSNFGTDLKARIDSEMAKARSRFDHCGTTVPTAPTMPTVPPVQTTKYPDRLPGRNAQS
jgi:hypothetical protein